MKTNHFMRRFTLAALLSGAAFTAFACGDDDTMGDYKPGNNAQDSALLADSSAASDAAKSDAAAATDGGPIVSPKPRGELDNAGRAYFEAAAVADSDRAAYNAALRYGGDPSTLPAVTARLHALDMTDGTEDWPLFALPPTPAPEGTDAGAFDAGPRVMQHPLAEWALYDALIVDPNMPFSASAFLDVERSGGEQNSCGGRWFDDNAANKMATHLISRNRATLSVVQPAAATANLSFPYLLP